MDISIGASMTLKIGDIVEFYAEDSQRIMSKVKGKIDHKSSVFDDAYFIISADGRYYIIKEECITYFNDYPYIEQLSE